MKAMRELWLGWAGVVLLAVAAPAADSVVGSKHDLSFQGPGPNKAVSESEVCLFCHTPHRGTGEVPLWNHTMSLATYDPYKSSTLKAKVGQPTGSSKLCLSCHDGTVALGLVHSRPGGIAMQNGVTTMPPGRGNLGTDLRDDHPISFTYDSSLASSDGELKDPSTLTARVRLDHNHQMQCTSCHSPHNNQYGKFLVQDNTASALCLACHIPPLWQNATHATSTKTWTGSGPNPWPNTPGKTVAANACQNCHTPHLAGTPERLLNYLDEEQNCFVCHNGNVAAKNLQPEFHKISSHPVLDTFQVHDPMEDLINPTRHVECADCHNTHASRSAVAAAPNASGAIQGVRGVNAAGAGLTSISRQYELCFRCHADSVARGPASVNRQFAETNTRLEFNTANQSYHPVTGPRNNLEVPSLLGTNSPNTIIFCTDCHNNNQGPGAGGTGPAGPHGSVYPPLLERQLVLADNVVESPAVYALCYKCHDRNSILRNDSFAYHYKHIVEERAACTTCHDSHGVANAKSLINFNRNYVRASSNGKIEFIGNSGFSGNCSLTCHGEDHTGWSYQPGGQFMPRASKTRK